MTNMEKLIEEAVRNAINNTITMRVEAETSVIVQRLIDQHGIEYSALMHKALLKALENLNKESK